LSQKTAVITEARRKQIGMADRIPHGRGMTTYGDPVSFDPFFSGSWSGKEI
jgi:hypothetical protein